MITYDINSVMYVITPQQKAWPCRKNKYVHQCVLVILLYNCIVIIYKHNVYVQNFNIVIISI